MILLLVNVITYFGYQLVNPQIAKYALEMGIPSGTVGMLTGIYSFAALLSRPFSGRITDRFSKKMILIVSMGLLGVMFFLYNVATTPTSLMALRFLHGVVFGFNSTATMAIAADKIPMSKMSEGMGIYASTSLISMAIGPQISIMVSNKWGFEMLFITGGCITLAAMMIALVLHDRSDKKQDHTRERKKLRLTDVFCVAALIPTIVSAFLAAPTGSCNTYMVLYGDVRGIANIGIFFTVYTLIMIVARPIIGKLSDRLPVLTIGVPCCLIFAGGMVSLWLAHSLIGVIIAAVLCSLGYSIGPMLQGLCVKSVPKECIGAASATYFMGLDVGNTVGPMLYGALTPSLGYANSFLAFTVFIAAGLLTLIVGYRKKQLQT